MSFRLSFCFILAGVYFSFAQAQEHTHHVSRSFRISSSMSVEISNKYGRVQIIPWEKDSVRFEVDMRIRARDKQKLEKLRQNIELSFTPGHSYIVAQTKFREGGSDVFKDLMDIAESYFSSANSVIINYTVYMPDYINLKIENKFGDVYFDDHDGAVTLLLSYGDLKANRFMGRSDLKINNGDADINYIKDGNTVFSYANVRIREVSMISVQSQSSVITIEKSGNIKLNSRRDKLYLNEVDNLSGETYFSVANVGTLNHMASLGCRYGDVIFDNIRRSFSLLNLTSELTDMSLSFERPLSFDFDLVHHQSVLFNYPGNLAHINTNVIDQEQKLFSAKGSFGSGSSESKVALKAMRKCNLTILQR